MIDINKAINRILNYAILNNFISKRDKVFCANRLIEYLNIDSIIFEDTCDSSNIDSILGEFRLWGSENGFIENGNKDMLDNFDTEIISRVIPFPSIIEDKFFRLYKESPVKATNFFYDFSIKTNYIRMNRIKKDIRWLHGSKYGKMEISINLSKPEKDPRAIAKDIFIKNNTYPLCYICKENEGYEGSLNHPARGNHRMINLKLNDEDWYFQYSPYVYYNEHAIVLKDSHEPMRITKETFVRLVDFVKLFPHYFIGSNADLPIVGGSILNHDHFQGGNHTFPIEVAQEYNHIGFINGIEACLLKWPLSVIRLRGSSDRELIETAYKIYRLWKDYENKELNIIAGTDGVEHNTVTPIVRMNKNKFEMDLVLRNNRTSQVRPFGIFHPRQEYHHIKKENIGLIEAMGLAVLPSRLKRELEQIEKILIEEKIDALKEDGKLKKHYLWVLDIASKKQINEKNIEMILKEEIGSLFVKILEDCGVFKNNAAGTTAITRFLSSASQIY